MTITRTDSTPAPGLGLEVAVLATALVGAVAVGRLVRGGWTGPAAWPLLATTVTGVVVVALLARRPRIPTAATASIGVIAVVWVAVATTVSGATWFGVPQSRTPSRVDHALHGVRSVTAGWHWPLASVSGVVALAALVAGLAAVASRALLAHPARPPDPPSRPAAALIPSLILVACSSLASPDAGAVVLVVAFIVAGGATLVLGEPEHSVEWGRGPTRRVVRRVLLGLLVFEAALVGATALSPGPTGTAGRSGVGRTVAPTGLDLATDLVGLEQRDATVVMFQARTPTDTYWQVGQVTVWDGAGWGPDAATRAALTSSVQAPSPSPGTTGAGTARAQVTMAALVTRLLPAPPGTVSIQPSGAGTVTAVGVVAPRPTHPGLQYRTTNAPTPTGAELIAAASGDPGAGMDPANRSQDTRVPVDAAVLQDRARRITAGATGPLQQAEELVDYFHSGQFRYQVAEPAASGAGDPVLEFLDVTRTGNCQTYATAFALLARSLGLPTRVAIGFTGGTRAPDGSTVVRGGEAHAWPQVHLGAAGWVSFEPTPQLPGNELAPSDVISATPATTPVTTPPTTTAPTTTRPVLGSPPPTTGAGATPTPTVAPTTSASPTSPTTVTGAPLGHPASSGGWPGWATAIVIVAGLALGAALGRRAGRARRRRRRSSGAPMDPVVAAYDQATDPLAPTRWARRAAQSPSAHARSLRSRLVVQADPGADPLARALDDLVRLAGLAEAAVYGAQPLGDEDTAWADAAATGIAAVLALPANRERLQRSDRAESTGAKTSEPALSGARPE